MKYFIITISLMTLLVASDTHADTSSTLKMLEEIAQVTDEYDHYRVLCTIDMYRQMINNPGAYVDDFIKIMQMKNVSNSVKSITVYVTIKASLSLHLEYVNKVIELWKDEYINEEVLLEVTMIAPPWESYIVNNYKHRAVQDTYGRIAKLNVFNTNITGYANDVLSGYAKRSHDKYMNDCPEHKEWDCN